MFEEGNIIYFTPFYFPNGQSAAKPKYCIILRTVGDKSIIASLPTRSDNLPDGVYKNGCIEIPDLNLNAYVFENGIAITICGKSFDFNTFVYGHQIAFYSTDLFKDLYQIEGRDYKIWGKLKPELFAQLLLCLKTSKTVKRKFLIHF